MAARPARGSCRRRAGSSARRSRAPPSTPASTDGSAEHSTIASKRPTAPQVVGLAHVAVHEAHAGLAQARQVELRAAAVEVVERDDLPVGVAGGEREREVRADEARAAGDEDARHPPRLRCRRRAMRRMTLPADGEPRLAVGDLGGATGGGRPSLGSLVCAAVSRPAHLTAAALTALLLMLLLPAGPAAARSRSQRIVGSAAGRVTGKTLTLNLRHGSLGRGKGTLRFTGPRGSGAACGCRGAPCGSRRAEPGRFPASRPSAAQDGPERPRADHRGTRRYRRARGSFVARGR